jgi:hypothetical protein
MKLIYILFGILVVILTGVTSVLVYRAFESDLVSRGIIENSVDL